MSSLGQGHNTRLRNGLGSIWDGPPHPLYSRHFGLSGCRGWETERSVGNGRARLTPTRTQCRGRGDSLWIPKNPGGSDHQIGKDPSHVGEPRATATKGCKFEDRSCEET